MGLRDMQPSAAPPAGMETPSQEGAPAMETPVVDSPGATYEDEANHAGGEVDAAQAEQIFDFCLSQMYGGESEEGDLNPNVAGMLRSGEDPVTALAETSATIVSSAAMKHEGVEGPTLNVANLGVIAELADASKILGLYEYSEDELEEATVNSQAELAESTRSLPGVWNEEEATDDFNQLMAMNESGQLDEMLAGISQEEGPTEEPGGVA